MDRKHIKFSVDAQEYQKLLKEENEELKKKVAYLEKDNEVGQEAFRDMIKMKEENEKLKKEIVEYESVEQSLMKCVREGGGYDEMLPIHYPLVTYKEKKIECPLCFRKRNAQKEF